MSPELATKLANARASIVDVQSKLACTVGVDVKQIVAVHKAITAITEALGEQAKRNPVSAKK